MSNQLISVIHQWLSLMSISTEKKYVSQRLLSHPNYPSALCITSLLDDLGIENGVVKIDEVQLSEIPTPFLAFIDREEFAIVTNLERIENSIENFKSRWNGIVIYAEKPAEIVVPDELKKIKNLQHGLRMKWAMAMIVMAVLSGMALVQSTILNAILCLLSILGLVICGSIVLRELGINSVVSQKLCGQGEKTGCDAVLHATVSKLPLDIRFSDVGVSFFSGIMFLLLMNAYVTEYYQKTAQLFIAGVSLASIPFTFYSLYYQWKVIKQWCRSCLLVVIILWITAAMQSQYPFNLNSINIASALRIASIFVLPGTLWLLIRAHLNHHQELINSNLLLQRVYRSPELLENHLHSQGKIDTTPWDHDYQMGNCNAACQIIVVSSHFCGPCAETHELLLRLLAKHQDEVGITVRYLIKSDEQNSPKTTLARHMLKHALATQGFLKDPQQVRQMLSSWYRWKDSEKFMAFYPVAKEKMDMDVDDLLEQQEKWCNTSEIYYTPTVIINGYKLESPYTPTDLLEFSDTLIDLFSRVESTSEAFA